MARIDTFLWWRACYRALFRVILEKCIFLLNLLDFWTSFQLIGLNAQRCHLITIHDLSVLLRLILIIWVVTILRVLLGDLLYEALFLLFHFEYVIVAISSLLDCDTLLFWGLNLDASLAVWPVRAFNFLLLFCCCFTSTALYFQREVCMREL